MQKEPSANSSSVKKGKNREALWHSAPPPICSRTASPAPTPPGLIAKQKYSAHAKEMLVNVCSMIRQMKRSANPDRRQLASLRAQRTQLMDMLGLN